MMALLCKINIERLNKYNLIKLGLNKCLICKLSSKCDTSPAELEQAYVPRKIENCNLRDELFKPPITSSECFTLILPPPNVTGTLHLGHALTTTIQDVLIKWHRMLGKETMWVPGMDHAGIATQVIVEKKLWNEKRQTRHDIGREKFEQEAWNWKAEKADIIRKQLCGLGASLNWNYEMFTMDPQQSRAVIEAFIKLYDAGLIYEADSLVNWSCVLRSAISDIEVNHINITGPTKISIPGEETPVEFGVLTRFAYKLQDSDEEIVVATTRPETILGDVAVAVHPDDGRYSSLIGRHLWHPFRQETIPVISDDFVDATLGTGAVKITPAHDPTDFQVGKRHKLQVLEVINEQGKIILDPYKKKTRFEARADIISKLHDLRLLRGRDDHVMSIPVCSRSSDVVEFLIKPQWFIKCDGMAAKALEVVKRGELIIEPKSFEKNWFQWLENIRDWCISRQLWWGHRIPVYSCWKQNFEHDIYKIAAHNLEHATAEAAKYFGSKNVLVKQVDDVLDTWFSSALLPFSSFGWPEKSGELLKYYPLSMMETGHDILFFWVARMTMLGTQLTSQLPFSKVLLHGVVCDTSGRKMSKSLGNVIAPEDVIVGRSLEELEELLKSAHNSGLMTDEEFRNAVRGQRKMFPQGIPACGVDALRFTLCSHNIKNHFINFDVQECKANQLFGNKLWQATKFTIKWCREVSKIQTLSPPKNFSDLSGMDRWILSKLSHGVEAVNKSLERYELHTATAALKNFLYYEFCDVYLESTKRGLNERSTQHANNHCWVLATCLDISLKCLAPFMPYLCQHLHEQLIAHPEIARSPQYYPQKFHEREEQIEKDVEIILRAITAIRRLKKIFNITAKNKHKVALITRQPVYKVYERTIGDLASCDEISLYTDVKEFRDTESFVSDTIDDGVIIRLYVPEKLRKAFEVDAGKLDRKKEKLTTDLEKMRRIITADRYTEKISQEAHESNLRKITGLEEKIARIDYIQGIVKSNL